MPKKAPDLINDGLESPSSCWEVNSEPLEEKPALATSESPLQPMKMVWIEPGANTSPLT